MKVFVFIFREKTRGNESKLAEKYTREPRKHFKDIGYKINKLGFAFVCRFRSEKNFNAVLA